MFRRSLACRIKKGFSDAPALKTWMNIELIDEIVIHRHERDRMMINLNDRHIVLREDVIAKAALVFIEEVALETLKLRQRFFARNAPENRYGIEVIDTIRADEKMCSHDWTEVSTEQKN